MALADATQEQQAMRADLDRLIRLVEENRIEEARRLAPALVARWPGSRPIQRLARTLEPPKLLPNPPDIQLRSLDRERAWLREHASEYPGCWIAVAGDGLVAAAPDLGEVIDRISSIEGGAAAVLFFQPGS